MLSYLRYALATVCFAASVGCLALWWRSMKEVCVDLNYTNVGPYQFYVSSYEGRANLRIQPARTEILVDIDRGGSSPGFARHILDRLMYGDSFELIRFAEVFESQGYIGVVGRNVRFPLWYPVLISALAGVGVLRFRRQFSIRSAFVCLTAVAALLGMPVFL